MNVTVFGTGYNLYDLGVRPQGLRGRIRDGASRQS